MGRQQDRRIDERERSWVRMRRLTGWAIAASVAFAGMFGIALVRHDQAAAAQQQSTSDPQTSDDAPSPSTGAATDDSGVLQPPVAPPQPTHSRVHVSTGGS